MSAPVGGKPLRLLPTRRLGPLFWAQFAGALNDNLLKNAFVILLAYRGAHSPETIAIIVTLATAVFILPYFLFSATAGEIADKFEKTRALQRIKLVEIFVVLLGGLSLAWGGVELQLGVLFLLGVQAAFFGPVKYAILPELLPTAELVDGNALIDAGTFIAILLGTIAGGLLILTPYGAAVTAVMLLAVSIAGYGASLFVPPTGSAAPGLALTRNLAALSWAVIGRARAIPRVWRAILGISWFWLVSAALVSQFPNYAKEYLGADNEVVTLFLAFNCVGVGIGCFACSRILKGEISLRLLPWGALAMAACTLDLWWASPVPDGGAGPLLDAAQFLAEPSHWRIVADLVGVAMAAGIFVVPLYAIMQAESEPAARSRIVAANNILNALFIVIAGGGSALMLKLGSGVPAIFLVLAGSNAALAAALWFRRPELPLPRPRP